MLTASLFSIRFGISRTSLVSGLLLLPWKQNLTIIRKNRPQDGVNDFFFSNLSHEIYEELPVLRCVCTDIVQERFIDRKRTFNKMCSL